MIFHPWGAGLFKAERLEGEVAQKKWDDLKAKIPPARQERMKEKTKDILEKQDQEASREKFDEPGPIWSALHKGGW